MHIFSNIKDIKDFLKTTKQSGKSIGFVPTMGALHEGHLSLVQAAQKANDLVVCSIFVNPIQFNEASDLEKYPRTERKDSEKLQQLGCDVVFLPSVQMMYAQPSRVIMSFKGLDDSMEGAHRQGHFSGVGVVVAKLLNIVEPTRAYFGQKDLQQLTIIRQMVEDLSFGVDIIGCPIVREHDGLAMSSRNRRLSSEEREIAPKLFESLTLAKNALKTGKSIQETQNIVKEFFTTTPDIRLEYFEIVKSQNLNQLHSLPSKGTSIAICLAAFLGEIRLIDNLIFDL